MWPALLQLIELAPHVTRLVPMADRYLQSKADGGKAQRRALEEMAERLRGDLGQASEGTRLELTQLGQQLHPAAEQRALASVAENVQAARRSSDEMEARMKGMEARMARLWMILIAGLVALAMMAAVVIAMLLHLGQSVHGS